MTNTKSCKVCKKNIGKKMKLQCSDCNLFFHLNCGNVTEENARDMQQKRASWTCRECLDSVVGRRQSSLFDQPGDTSRRISGLFGRASLEATTSCDSELKLMFREMQTEMKEMRKALEFFNSKYEEELQRGKVLANWVSDISKENQDLRKEVDKLKSTLDFQVTSKLKNNICISGLLDSEDGMSASKEKIVKLGQNLSVPITDQDFDNIKLLKLNNGTKAIVTFKSSDLKDKLLRERSRKGKITISSMGFGDSTQSIFVEEEMSKDTYNLFRKAKQTLKGKHYKYIWHRNGRIMARKNDGDRYVIIKNDLDLEDL